MKADELITGITVTWNTKSLLERAYTSIRKFHPSMKIIVVDGSDEGNDCIKYIEALSEQDINFSAFHANCNIGHGRGMNVGIKEVKTPYVLFFDSDIIMVDSPLEGMLAMMEDNTFGVGYSEKVGYDGHDYGVFPHHQQEPGVRYLHPYFQLVQVKEYFKYKPYIHHGAPCISTMLDIYKKKLSDIVLKEFPELGHTNGCGASWKPCAGKYIIHDVAGFGGTGKMRVGQGLPHIEGEWERDYK